MTANEVNPFWIRSSMVKYQLGDLNGAMDLMRRVENRFPEAPEVSVLEKKFNIPSVNVTQLCNAIMVSLIGTSSICSVVVGKGR